MNTPFTALLFTHRKTSEIKYKLLEREINVLKSNV